MSIVKVKKNSQTIHLFTLGEISIEYPFSVKNKFSLNTHLYVSI